MNVQFYIRVAESNQSVNFGEGSEKTLPRSPAGTQAWRSIVVMKKCLLPRTQRDGRGFG